MERDPIGLPLLDWKPPRKVIPFPASAWIGRARHVASVLAKQPSERARETYWCRTCDSIIGRLIAAGIDEDAALAEIAGFRAAVENELARLQFTDRAQR